MVLVSVEKNINCYYKIEALTFLFTIGQFHTSNHNEGHISQKLFVHSMALYLSLRLHPISNAFMVDLATQTPCLVEISSHSPAGPSKLDPHVERLVVYAVLGILLAHSICVARMFFII